MVGIDHTDGDCPTHKASSVDSSHSSIGIQKGRKRRKEKTFLPGSRNAVKALR
jgi:hypothetical protein